MAKIATSQTVPIRLGAHHVEVVVDTSGGSTQTAELEFGLAELTLSAPAGGVITAEWSWPVEDSITYWRSHISHHKGLAAEWQRQIPVEPTLSAPVGQLIAADDTARLTFALSSNVDDVSFVAGIHEETKAFVVRIGLTAPEDGSDVTLRLDTRPSHFSDGLRGIDQWWRDQLGGRLLRVPDVAFAPTYCTWYADHQDINAASVEARAEQAAAAGFDAIIVDGGWHTSDNGRTYEWCGDWTPDPGKFPDFPPHVKRVRAQLAYLLWMTPSLIGKNTDAWASFHDKLLGWEDAMVAGVLDPRFPEVRRHITELCVRAIREWDVDGLKIDFLDSFAGHEAPVREGMDEPVVGLAVELMLADIAREMVAAKPDAMIEFRQNYTGPRMWQYGNILRAGDCPMDAVENKVRTVDLRLLSGGRAVHSDPLVWNSNTDPQNIALQLINVIFATPQVSVALDEQSDEQAATLQHWLRIARDQRDLLQDGQIRPSRPDLRYPLVSSVQDEREFIAVYADTVARPVAGSRRVMIANGSARDAVVIEADSSFEGTVVQHDGTSSTPVTIRPRDGWAVLEVPVGGLADLRRINS